MKTFELTIIDQKRAIFALLIFLSGIFSTLLVSKKVYPGFIFLGVLLSIALLCYYAVGKITISISDGKIDFDWKKKLIFNYKNIESINESDIEKVIIDHGQYLRKIITKDRVINLNTSKIKPKDSAKLISYFVQKIKTQNIEIKNSWENISKKKLKVFYVLNWIAIIASLSITILVSIFKGFKPSIFFILAVLPTLLISGQQIKKAVQKKDSNSN